MPRIFVHHDKEGNVLGVASVEHLLEGQEHPFHLTDDDHNVIELAADDPAHSGELAKILERRIDLKARKAAGKQGSRSKVAAKAPPRRRSR